MKLDRKFGLLGMMTLLVFTACGKKPAPVTPAPQTTEPARVNGNSMPATNGSDNEAAEAARRRSVVEAMVFFDYDRSDVRSDAAAVLNQKLPLLREDMTIRVRIDGHADERGSVEYNLALGMRRAQSVKDYLVGFGLDAARLQTNTLGEDRPLDAGKTEAAYARNRRAEFMPTAGSSLGIR
jgi:peptidoglycan-associated lipoprotein